MSSMRQTIHSIHNKKFWTEFFHLYESLPALWDVNNPVYKNRQVKSDAYDIMVDKLKEIEPNADREDVLRKVNIFRTNFRRECSRINMSLQEGRHYQSTLWYFDLLCFLQTADTRRDRKRKIDDDGEKSIMRKRRSTNMMHKSNNQFIIARKDNLIEYQPHSTHEYEYDLEEEPDFDYVPDELTHVLVDGKNDSSAEIQQNHLVVNNYQEEEDDDDEQSQQDYIHQGEFQNYSPPRNIQTNKKIKLTEANVSQLDGQINTNETLIEVNNVSEEHQQAFHEYTTCNENEALQTGQWCIKTSNSPNRSTYQLEKEGLHVGNISNTNTFKFCNNTSTKLVRDVKTMTSDSCHGGCCSKLSESSEILAKSWAIQYDELSKEQKLLARKAINDILFEGCMDHLVIGSNGRVIINSTDYKIRHTSKFTSNEEVESSEIYEQSTIIASSASSTSNLGAGQSITISTNVASTSKDHTTDEWLKL